jgi:uncharacterized protein
MAASYFVDTGAIVACLDHRDRWHQSCREALARLPVPLITSTAVLAEVFHLLSTRRVDQSVTWAFLRSGAFSISPITTAEFPHLHSLMSQYADRPMDFAEATLVRLAQRESITRIFTIDHADFETYRIGGRRRLTVVPRALS